MTERPHRTEPELTSTALDSDPKDYDRIGLETAKLHTLNQLLVKFDTDVAKLVRSECYYFAIDMTAGKDGILIAAKTKQGVVSHLHHDVESNTMPVVHFIPEWYWDEPRVEPPSWQGSFGIRHCQKTELIWDDWAKSIISNSRNSK